MGDVVVCRLSTLGDYKHAGEAQMTELEKKARDYAIRECALRNKLHQSDIEEAYFMGALDERDELEPLREALEDALTFVPQIEVARIRNLYKVRDL